MSFFDSCDANTLDDQLSLLLRGCGHFLFLQSYNGTTQDSVIQILKKEGPMSQASIVERLNIKAASASELITKLERKGLVERKRVEEDRRKVLLYLTEKGRKVPEMKKTEKTHNYDALSEEEKEALAPILKKLLGSWVKEVEK